MKSKLLVFSVFFSLLSFGQRPYENEKDFNHLYGPIPIKKGMENSYFKYAVQLYQQDSFRKAGQLFNRLYSLDTLSLLSKEAYGYQKRLEDKILAETNFHLLGGWDWTWSGSNWGPHSWREKSKDEWRILIEDEKITFFKNDSIYRSTTYTIGQHFDWFRGELVSVVKYQDSGEEWYFSISQNDNFITNHLLLDEKSVKVCGNARAGYVKKITAL